MGSIVKERNKRAVEIVIVVVTTIEQAGKYTPHLKAKTIIERIPQLQESLDKAKTNSDKNKILKRAFTKAWELLWKCHTSDYRSCLRSCHFPGRDSDG